VDKGGVLLYNDYIYMEYIRTTKIIKTGTSLCVVIPKDILDALKWERGDQVVFGIFNNDAIAIRRIADTEIKLWNK